MKKAFIIGNGPSRLAIDLEKLKEHGTTFGCNALYRDFMPDILVAVDPRILREWKKNNVLYKAECWTRKNLCEEEEFKHYKLNWSTRIAANSGASAMGLAIDKGFDEIYLLGFDLKCSSTYNNIYMGTANYRTDAHGDSAFERQVQRWTQQLKKRKYPVKEYLVKRVLGKDSVLPPGYEANKRRWKNIQIDNFKDKYGC